jgi:hypothetical protein
MNMLEQTDASTYRLKNGGRSFLRNVDIYKITCRLPQGRNLQKDLRFRWDLNSDSQDIEPTHYVCSALWALHSVDIVRVTGVSEVQIASIFRDEASNFNERSVYIDVAYTSETSATNKEQRPKDRSTSLIADGLVTILTELSRLL